MTLHLAVYAFNSSSGNKCYDRIDNGFPKRAEVGEQVEFPHAGAANDRRRLKILNIRQLSKLFALAASRFSGIILDFSPSLTTPSRGTLRPR